jgi:hypothetical protein
MSSEHDITIHWANKPEYNRFKVALEVQDAVNLRALAREFVKVVDTASDGKPTKDVWDDAAVVLFVNKFETLCRSDARFGASYRVCREEVLKAKLLAAGWTQHTNGTSLVSPDGDCIEDSIEAAAKIDGLSKERYL